MLLYFSQLAQFKKFLSAMMGGTNFMPIVDGK